ncbi:hypothetical protein DRP53_00450 [candidate division WOR-3 bacterium]|uniref:Uncharacterized protein n=1 Tax=candidate division WOR-3 bacterium TaxID=2052148 RepID=A0A660SLV8_UNCW3|nr:MAG: hypothetical protein DRP53_00450 [candidate division WOR-3 bacterium]
MLISLLFGLSITDFRPPSSRVYGWELNGGFHHLRSNHGDFSSHLYYYLESDTIEFSISGGGSYSYSTFDSSYQADLSSRVQIRSYLSNSPFFIGGMVRGSSQWDRIFGEEYRYHSFDLTLSSGVGRIRDGIYVVRALAINKILLTEGVISQELKPETILALAQLLSQRTFFLLRYERYFKYLAQRVESILEKDPAYKGKISGYCWFKIFELADNIYYRGLYELIEWERRFGIRLSLDLSAGGITKGRSGDRVGLGIDDLYGYPEIGVTLEYGYPIDLSRQLSFTASYTLSFVDTMTSHYCQLRFAYGYGIIDRYLIQPQFAVGNSWHIREGRGDWECWISPGIGFYFYLEDRISFESKGDITFYRDRTGWSGSTYLRLGVDHRIF